MKYIYRFNFKVIYGRKDSTDFFSAAGYLLTTSVGCSRFISIMKCMFHRMCIHSAQVKVESENGSLSHLENVEIS